ncbi:MAG: hypothetical protein OXU77_02545, partial [Gammaproteobacteria bacterium]|nr:hypothetical protein [Gammaproteobacteria bacterium]
MTIVRQLGLATVLLLVTGCAALIGSVTGGVASDLSDAEKKNTANAPRRRRAPPEQKNKESPFGRKPKK